MPLLIEGRDPLSLCLTTLIRKHLMTNLTDYKFNLPSGLIFKPLRPKPELASSPVKLGIAPLKGDRSRVNVYLPVEILKEAFGSSDPILGLELALHNGSAFVKVVLDKNGSAPTVTRGTGRRVSVGNLTDVAIRFSPTHAEFIISENEVLISVAMPPAAPKQTNLPAPMKRPAPSSQPGSKENGAAFTHINLERDARDEIKWTKKADDWLWSQMDGGATSASVSTALGISAHEAAKRFQKIDLKRAKS